MAIHTLSVNRFVDPRRYHLFYSEDFFKLHDDGTGRYYEWLDQDNRPVAAIHAGQIEPGVWRSPFRGTFAGFDFTDDLPVAFIDAVLADLKAQGAKSLEVLFAPSAHNPHKDEIAVKTLKNAGFSITREDVNFTIDVTDTPLSQRMRSQQKQRIQKCLNKNFTVSEAPVDRLPAVYSIIAANAKARGFSVSMTLDQLEAMHAALPGSLVPFAVMHGDIIASAAVCVRISPDILYIFYVGDQAGYASDSPVVMMVDGIYTYARRHGYKILDYGTASIGRERNEGLIDFKRRLGFVECSKCRMKKDL